MTFLPIVQRELRVAARRKSTYRIRAWMAAVAVLIGLFSLLPAMVASGFGSLGKGLYSTLTGFVFFLCLLAGVLLAADRLSEEKREGTLGLLFLTDLRGYDVVLGKFLACGLNAFYGLLAILPITGLCLLLGGLTSGEFWRMNLALLNTLFFSMATGICASAFGRNAQRVMGATLGWLLVVGILLPVVAGFRGGGVIHIPQAWSCMEWISPLCPFTHALEPRYFGQPEKYWWGLAISHLVGWSLLAAASYALPHRWQQAEEKRSPWRGLGGVIPGSKGLRGGAPPPEVAARAQRRHDLLPVNPVLWLTGSGTGLQRIAWILAGAAIAIEWLVILLDRGRVVPFDLTYYGIGPFGFALKCLLAIQACRFFAEARRSGALELLLCTPMTSQEIIEGQRLAARRNFQWPVVALLVAVAAPSLARAFAGAAGGGWRTAELPQVALWLGIGGIYCLRMVADCWAVVAFGMYLALTLKKPSMALPLTVLYVLLLPLVLCWLDLFADLFFIMYGTSRLNQLDLRRLLAQEYQRGSASGG
jgi:ABC-type transport system involved in cytochrome c biogenesis permease component